MKSEELDNDSSSITINNMNDKSFSLSYDNCDLYKSLDVSFVSNESPIKYNADHGPSSDGTEIVYNYVFPRYDNLYVNQWADKNVSICWGVGDVVHDIIISVYPDDYPNINFVYLGDE